MAWFDFKFPFADINLNPFDNLIPNNPQNDLQNAIFLKNQPGPQIEASSVNSPPIWVIELVEILARKRS